ncbi:hypothetical protein KAW18_01795 [candidate division WOR-3 bacterium]|nr:hypothetical protein [candidate division WOR-3 bacterium]
MIDIYALIAVGSALIIGFIPLLSKKFRGKDFLVSYHVDKSKFKEYLMQLHKDGDWIE